MRQFDLPRVKHIVTHANCADGMASAMILKSFLPDASVQFVSHGAELDNLEATPGMLFCDICPPRGRAQDFRDAKAIVLDHHVSQRDVVESFGYDGVYADLPGVSGAMLAYLFVETGTGLASPNARSDEDHVMRCFQLAQFAGVYDTWQRQDPRWQDARAQTQALTFFDQHTLVQCPSRGWASYLTFGWDLLRKHDRSVERAVKNAHVLMFMDSRLMVGVISGKKYASDASEISASGWDILAAFDYIGPELHLSFRTRRADIDLSALCAKSGGGGHKGAAGVVLKAEGSDPYARIRMVVATGLAGA